MSCSWFLSYYFLRNRFCILKCFFNELTSHQWRSLTRMTGSKTYIPKNFYRTGGSKTYIPTKFYTKTTYITLLSEKFGGSGAPLPFYTSPLLRTIFL
ncbi:hypothetical protein Hanom_Chr16g01435241 [Helianthus anomalus]